MKPVTRVDSATGRVTRTKSGRVCPCGKVAYSSRKIASSEAKRVTRETGELLEPYHDYRCHALHIGHRPAPFDPARARAS